MTTSAEMASLLRAWMAANGITQAWLAREIGRSTKHVNQVFMGKAGTRELDYWAFALGLRFDVTLVQAPVGALHGETAPPTTTITPGGGGLAEIVAGVKAAADTPATNNPPRPL